MNMTLRVFILFMKPSLNVFSKCCGYDTEHINAVDSILNMKLYTFWQGCAKMTSRIGGSVAGGNWKYAHGTAHFGRNFSVKWLKV